MQLQIFQVNAFTSDYRGGNPAGVCPLPAWLPDELMQSIARENGYSETAFFMPSEERYDLRWFTPGCEVDLCGHATLATAFALKSCMGQSRDIYRFNTRSGLISVESNGDIFMLDMPVMEFSPAGVPAALVEGLGVEPKEVYKGQDYLAVLSSADEVTALKPDYVKLRQVDTRGIIVTARGSGNVDFVSRWFGGPDVGIDEDPVTGSAHCMLVSYWGRVLKQRRFVAKQLSARGGDLQCELVGERVRVGGRAVLYLTGKIYV